MPEVCELLAMKVFVDTDDDVRLARRITRDVAQRGRDVQVGCVSLLLCGCVWLRVWLCGVGGVVACWVCGCVCVESVACCVRACLLSFSLARAQLDSRRIAALGRSGAPLPAEGGKLGGRGTHTSRGQLSHPQVDEDRWRSKSTLRTAKLASVGVGVSLHFPSDAPARAHRRPPPCKKTCATTKQTRPRPTPHTLSRTHDPHTPQHQQHTTPTTHHHQQQQQLKIQPTKPKNAKRA